MNRADDSVYRKTALGLTALSTRSCGLVPRARTALILVNGRDSLAALTGKLGPEAEALIEMLLGMRLVEEMHPPSVNAPAPPAPAVAVADARLASLKRAAIVRLAPHFGPDVDIVCRPLLAAGTSDAYATALGAIESKLAIYLGRRGAAELLAGLRPWDDPP
jgi:hypothetical protein